MKYLLLLTIAFISLCCSCSKGKTPAINNLPANLVVNATVSTDNSGNVLFTATATNAVTYEFNFGNDVSQLVPSGTITYMYPASGTYTVNVIAKSAGAQTISKSIQVTVTVSKSLVWSDEFNTAGAPDPAKWVYDIGTGSGGWGNNELEYYTDRSENVSVSNGTLKITARKETYNGSAYTSARILSRGKFAFKYGKVEVSAKLPAGIGTWPAIWMLGSDFSTAGWPACGEMDIMEHRGSELNKIFGTLHYPGHAGGNANGGTKLISNATTAFHKYGLEWTATEIKFSVDDVPYHTVANSAAIPFNHAFFFIMNVAMGGNFAGYIDPAINLAVMEVDYIRVYQ